MSDDTTKRRRDWRSLQQKIGDVFIRLYRENQRQPTNAELAKEVGVCERTIVRHLATIDLADYFSEQRGVPAVMAPNVMMAIYNSALKGSTRAQKLILQIVFEWAEPKSFEQPEKTTTTQDTNMVATTEEKVEEKGFAGRQYKVGTDIPAGEYVTVGSGYLQISSDSSGVLKDGKYKVGVDFPAGEYKVAPNGDGYLAVTTSASEPIGSIVTNNNFNTEKYITVQDGRYLKLNRASLTLN